MKRLIASAIITCVILQPVVGSEFILDLEQMHDSKQICTRLCSFGVFNPFEARRFILESKTEIQERYQIKVDLHLVVEKAIEEMIQAGFSAEEVELAKVFYKELLKDPKNQQVHY